ncbi:NB-ARC domain-containing protein, partial [Catellatospora aurea]
MQRLADRFADPELWGLRRPLPLIELVDPDRATVLETVGRAARLVRPPGLLAIYFVGHAVSIGGHLSLAMADADQSRPETSMVTVANLVEEVSRNAGRDAAVVLLLDCCFAGQAETAVPAPAVRAADSAGWYFLGAADRATPASAPLDGDTTLFTGALLTVLRGMPGRGRSLRGQDVFDGLTELLPHNPPVHNHGAAGARPWLTNLGYKPPPPRPLEFPPLTGSLAASRRRPRMFPQVAPAMVTRPELIAAILHALGDTADASPVVITAVRGTGGFGKTTLVTQTCHRPEVDELFTGGILWTELGHDLDGPALADKINDLTEQLTGVRPTLSGPQEAGFRLGEALDACLDPVLLVVDDVWRDDQIRPFLSGGRHCRRLVTTRFSLAALSAAVPVDVDVMADREATAVLTAGLDPLPDASIRELLQLTGRWPLLLGITNRTIARNTDKFCPVYQAARDVADRLRQAGPDALDNPHDITSPRRHAMVAACINASLDALPAFTRDRYLELGIFAEDTDIPYTTLALLWQESGGLDAFQTRQLGNALIDASLASPGRDQPGLRLHDVIRTHVRDSAGADHQVRTNIALITAASRLLASPNSLTDSGHAPRPWWTLPREHDHLQHYLVDHLTDAGLQSEVQLLITDLRWTAARIRRSGGPVHAEADLARSQHPQAKALADALRHNAHLLSSSPVVHAIDDTLASRLDGKSSLQPIVDAFTRTLTHRPRLANHWPLPDQPHPALRRPIHTGHRHGAGQVHIAPDGTWLATIANTSRGSGDPVVQIWDPH